MQLEHKILTVNPNKGNMKQHGENLYYSVYNETILDNGVYVNDKYLLKKGDYIICTVKNTNTTTSAKTKEILFHIGKNTYVIFASESALVINNGE